MQKLPLSHFLFTDKDVLCITLTQNSPDKTVANGSEVTLLCTYDGHDENPDLFWYRKRQDGALQFILYRDDTRVYDADFVQGRFFVKHSKAYSAFHLVISPVTLEDTATYYCALSTTVVKVLRKPLPKPLEHRLGVAPFTGSHIPLCQAFFSDISIPVWPLVVSHVIANQRPGHSQEDSGLPRSRQIISHFESLVIGYGELQFEEILSLSSSLCCLL
ncbi:hypothetical protein STEG23_032057 [Scotinomys teguina]